MRDVFVCDAVRTPIGRFGGALAKVRADDLAAAPIKALPAFLTMSAAGQLIARLDAVEEVRTATSATPRRSAST